LSMNILNVQKETKL